MTSKIAELLKCNRMPVALIRTNQKPEEALMFKEGNKGCIIALLNAASQGKIYFLSIGGKENKEGEYYKESPELARAYINELPSIESKKFIVLKPYNMLNEYEIPDAVIFLVNADELSALVTLANYDKSTQDNVEIKFGAGCAQTFLYTLANQDNEKDICTIGLTDPSARKCIDKDLLSFSIPYRRFCIMEEKAENSFLTHNTWNTLLKRKNS